MVDLVADTLLGRGEGGEVTAVDIGVIVSDLSLLDPGHADAATVEGSGSVPFEAIRQQILRIIDGADPELQPTLRTMYKDRTDGQLVAVKSRSREFPRGLATLLRTAHQSCRGPYCDAGIRQIDHIKPWSQGGKTTLEKGNGLCVADNQKEEAGLRALPVLDEDGVRRTVEWLSRYGQKAQRRGINVDPVGTAQRKLALDANANANAEAVAEAEAAAAAEAEARREIAESDSAKPNSAEPASAAPISLDSWRTMRAQIEHLTGYLGSQAHPGDGGDIRDGPEERNRQPASLAAPPRRRRRPFSIDLHLLQNSA